jgi:DNA-directed RNA polymerase specialized sigma24 family protein
MIDAFWTKWRVRRLCRGDAALVCKWLDDYVGWLYGRLWVLSGHEEVRAGQALVKVFSSAASHLDQCLQRPGQMSEWLLTRIDLQALDSAVSSRQISDVQSQVQMLWTQSLSETMSFSPELLDASQRAVLLLSRDDQEVMMCRYLRLESPGEMASHHGQTLTDMQSLLYRARHSFRRSLESLTQAGSSQPEKLILADQDVLDVNLEKLFRSLGPKPVFPVESLESLKANILDILCKQGAADLKLSLRRWAIAAAVILVGIGGVFCLYQSNREVEPQPNVVVLQQKTKQAVPEKSSLQNEDVGQIVKRVLALGERHDAEGLVEILRNGPYPAQLAAAHFLSQFGDKSAIDALDRAAQKWYPDKPSETNPFVDAIAAIETRIRDEKKWDDLERKKQAILETAKPLLKKRLEKAEPNAVQMEPNAPQSEPNDPEMIPAAATVQSEPNGAGTEPNQTSSEPNAAGAAAISAASDANQIAEPNSVI